MSDEQVPIIEEKMSKKLPFTEQEVVDRVTKEKKREEDNKRFVKRLFSRPINIDQINKFLEHEGYTIRLKRVGTQIWMFDRVQFEAGKEVVGYSLGHKRPTQLSMLQWINLIDGELKKIQQQQIINAEKNKKLEDKSTPVAETK